MGDPIEPEHYRWSGLEPITVIEAWRLGFCLGRCVKYVCRAGRKPGADRIEDLRKALWYLAREIAITEKESACESSPSRPST